MEIDTQLDVKIRVAESSDTAYLITWLKDKETQEWYPVKTEEEIEVTARSWIRHKAMRSAFTCIIEEEPVGMGVLYLEPFEKLKHQCELAMIVEKSFRNEGIGKLLLQEIIYRAKTRFKLEWLYLHIYDGNPAIRLYERSGFKEFGRQKGWLKQGDKTLDRILMQKEL